MRNNKGNIALILLGLVGGLLVISALGTALGIITLPWHKLDTQIQTNRDIIDKTYDADNAIYNYEWFKQTAEDINATKKKVSDAENALLSFEKAAGSRDTWTFEDKTEDSRLRSVSLGLQNHYTQLVADYNAHANEVNRSIFKDDLPLFFNLNPF